MSTFGKLPLKRSNDNDIDSLSYFRNAKKKNINGQLQNLLDFVSVDPSTSFIDKSNSLSDSNDSTKNSSESIISDDELPQLIYKAMLLGIDYIKLQEAKAKRQPLTDLSQKSPNSHSLLPTISKPFIDVNRYTPNFVPKQILGFIDLTKPKPQDAIEIIDLT